jgi:uncharacterized protein YbgA (DUF1722 family)/uncharacterized protein YbbK (DUF523 family)
MSDYVFARKMVMREFERPVIVVSKCLEFEPVRWDGQMISEPLVRALREHVDFIPVCPEVEIGLGVPRKPVRIVDDGSGRRLIQLETERDVTEEMTRFAHNFLSSMENVDGFLLKSRSPSSGIKDVKVYPGTGRVAASGRGAGFFGGAVLGKFPGLAVEDEGRLKDFDIREPFLAKVFAHADLRRVTRSGRMKELVNFHSRNKHLLMAYNQKEMRVLGRIVANPEREDFGKVVSEYEQHFNLALGRKPRKGSVINVLMHALGYFKDRLGSAEKSHFLDLLGSYRDGKLPLIALLTLVKSWGLKYQVPYILEQTLFEPFPEGLVSMRDSGKSVES